MYSCVEGELSTELTYVLLQSKRPILAWLWTGIRKENLATCKDTHGRGASSTSNHHCPGYLLLGSSSSHVRKHGGNCEIQEGQLD